jgi:hypothetical protein
MFSEGMIFITVNQVLVRLWARRGRKSDRMWSVSREGSSWGAGPPVAVATCSEACVVYATGMSLPPTSIGGLDTVACHRALDPVILSKMIQYRIVLGLGVWCLVSVCLPRQLTADH